MKNVGVDEYSMYMGVQYTEFIPPKEEKISQKNC